VQIRLALNLIPFYATLSAPFIPDAAANMHENMGTSPEWPVDVNAALHALSAGHPFTVPEVLFAKITDECVADWEVRFSGTRD